jgi:hypothetical protein
MKESLVKRENRAYSEKKELDGWSVKNEESHFQ